MLDGELARRPVRVDPLAHDEPAGLEGEPLTAERADVLVAAFVGADAAEGHASRSCAGRQT